MTYFRTAMIHDDHTVGSVPAPEQSGFAGIPAGIDERLQLS